MFKKMQKGVWRSLSQSKHSRKRYPTNTVGITQRVASILGSMQFIGDAAVVVVIVVVLGAALRILAVSGHAAHTLPNRIKAAQQAQQAQYRDPTYRRNAKEVRVHQHAYNNARTNGLTHREATRFAQQTLERWRDM